MRFLMSRLDPRSAPIITRLAKVMTWPSLDLTVGAALTLMVALGVLMVVHVPYLLRTPSPFGGPPLGVSRAGTIHPPLDSVITTMTVISIAAFLIMPLVTAVVAALIASADVHSEAFTLLKLTNIPRSALEQAYMATALFRLRVPMALVAALLPVFAFGITDQLLEVIVLFIGAEHLTPADTTMRALFFGALAIGLWGMNLFAAASVSQSALRRKSRLAPLIVTPLLTFLVSVIVTIAVLTYLGPLLTNPVALWDASFIRTWAAIALVLGIGPYALWWLTMWIARRLSVES